jgi:hypothetical protein
LPPVDRSAMALGPLDLFHVRGLLTDKTSR